MMRTWSICQLSCPLFSVVAVVVVVVVDYNVYAHHQSFDCTRQMAAQSHISLSLLLLKLTGDKYSKNNNDTESASDIAILKVTFNDNLLSNRII
jgi:hypothetical protein